jgi:catechol 2,3-dioxygenase-like lactoylglutathione lyase family enzyme
MTVQSISAITLAVQNMARSVDFYHRGAGIPILYGGPDASFTSLTIGGGYLNLILAEDANVRWWGRCILYVDDVDAHHRRMVDAGFSPDGNPADAPWRERYYHITDPDGHEISFAKPLADSPPH